MSIESMIESIGGLYADTIMAALEEARKHIKNESWDLGTLVKNASWSAYCEGLEHALQIVNGCTAAGLKELAAKRERQAKPDVSKATPSTPAPIEDHTKEQ